MNSSIHTNIGHMEREIPNKNAFSLKKIRTCLQGIDLCSLRGTPSPRVQGLELELEDFASPLPWG